MERCWWCQKITKLTGEHFPKKTDIKDLFHEKFFSNGKHVNLIRYSGETFPIQGPNSQRLKLVPDLCANCNGTRSQSSDKSYTHFIKSFKNIKNEFLDSKSTNRLIDLVRNSQFMREPWRFYHPS